MAALVLVIWVLGVPATPRYTKDIMRMGGWLIVPSLGVVTHEGVNVFVFVYAGVAIGVRGRGLLRIGRGLSLKAYFGSS